jgi:hypothetical protein
MGFLFCNPTSELPVNTSCQALLWFIGGKSEVCQEDSIVLHDPDIKSAVEFAFESVVLCQRSFFPENAFAASCVAVTALHEIQTQPYVPPRTSRLFIFLGVAC